MRLKFALLTTALAFGLGTTAALAEDAPGAESDITIVENSGTANVPGTKGRGPHEEREPGALSAPEKNRNRRSAERHWRHERHSAANVPGADADGDKSVQNLGSLSASEKDADKM